MFDISYFLVPMLLTKVEHILEIWYITLPILAIFYVLTNRRVIDNTVDFYEEYIKGYPKGTVVLESEPSSNQNSLRYQGIMWHLSRKKDSSIKKVNEVYFERYNFRKDKDDMKHFFRVNQSCDFKVTDKISGSVDTRVKDEKTDNTTKQNEIHSISLYSEKLNVTEIIEFLDNICEEHKNYILEKTIKNPIIVEASFNEKDDDFDFYSYNWSSSVTFENRFFENKNKILEQVNFFLENPEYFEKKGIPYQLGMFIHGEPGCGKTSFIKALANLTGRHIIDIKLSDNMNLLEFKNIFLEERLAEDLYIPIDKRIYVLEDIDVMGNTVHKRKKKDSSTDLSTDFEMADSTDDEEIKEKPEEKPDLQKELVKMLTRKEDKEEKSNNMSYLLNVLDGLQENKGKIIVATSNHIEKIDPAIKRPGRLGDIMIEFKQANKKIVEEILSFYWEEEVELDFEIKPISHCNVVEMCRSSKILDDCLEKISEFKDNKVEL